MHGLKIREKLSEDLSEYKAAAKVDMMLERFKPLKVKPIADSNYQLMKHSNL
jgi:hypothetical protein